MTIGETTAAPGISSGEQAIAQLWARPVGRRWLLKAGFVAGAGAAVSSVLAPAATAATKPKGTAAEVMHFTLGDVQGLKHYKHLEAHVNGTVTKLTAHTSHTRKLLTQQGTLWSKVDRSKLTHYASLKLPTHRAIPILIYATNKHGRRVVLLEHFHVPASGLRTLAKAAFHLQHSYRSVIGSPTRLKRLGLRPSDIRSVAEVLALETVTDYEQTAKTLTMSHPNIANLNTTDATVTKSLLGMTPEVTAFGTTMQNLHNAGHDWGMLTTATNKDGTPSKITIGQTTTTFQTLTLSQDPGFQSSATSAVVAGIHGVRDTANLGTVNSQPIDAAQNKADTATWHQGEGTLPTEVPYNASAAAATVTASVQNPGLLYGTYTQPTGGFSNRQQQVKVYNNFVRWISIYVQYLDASGNNLSTAKGPVTFPDTTYAQHLGLLPQIFTILGVPIWDTNTQTVTLDFPENATTARMLYTGLGNEIVGGGWRQYFPPTAYSPNAIAPQQEVTLAAVLTGIMSIGMTAFALVADFDIASAWEELNNLFVLDGGWQLFFEEITAVIDTPAVLAAAEAIAALVVTGAATYEQIEANGSDSNIWSILAGLGSLIPKLLFNPQAAKFVEKVALVIVGAIGVGRLEGAIPFVGQLLSLLEVAGDVATLVEAIGETLASPWVISNAVTLSYPVTVKVSIDHRSTTWPPTARSWRLESKIDGSSALTSLTSAFNADGNSTADIVINTTAPFGGQTITWSLVVLDAAGHQVGAGAFQAPNDDANNLASNVSFAIVEVPAAVDATTVFARAVTTTWSPAGYTWTPNLPDTGTRLTSAVQEVAGVTVSTRLGVAGIVWKQNDKYWLRGVPFGENGNTIKIGGATKQGYARQPYLLYDALVGDGDKANHVLVEPDDTDQGYHVRALTIDPTSGALSWDPTVSLAYFPLPVDAAALCPSGWVVAIHTTSGRLGITRPAATAIPPLASYSAGPGTEVGLLSSPIAVAVTNRGTVVALESNVSAAAPYQLSAFDVLGSPVRLFGTSTPQAFTLPLPSGRTYTDIGIDGSDDIYLLSYSGTGSAPSDYRIDVYQRNGTPIATNSPGTNIPHFAVDYWRSIYAANFTALGDTSGHPHIDSAIKVVEPSISRWDPAG